jgi:hypothetical protein
MRYTEIITELKMNPNHLAKFGKTTGDTILAGFEAEVILLDVLETKEEPDYSVDQKIGWRDDIDDIANFFNVNRREYRHALIKLEEHFEEWQQEEVDKFVNEHLPTVADRMADEFNEHWDDGDEDYVPKQADDFTDEAREACENQAESKLDLSFQKFCSDERMTNYSSIAETYDLTWPTMQTIEPDGYDEDVAGDIADFLGDTLGKKVVANTKYHGARRQNTYHVEPDQSLQPDDPEDMGIEIISYPMPLPEMMSDLEKTMKFIDIHAYTNNTTGLHINMSIPDSGGIDYVKLVLFAGDDFVLKQFDREFNTYAESAFDKISRETRNSGVQAFDLLKSGMIEAASKALKERNLNKYTSVNMHDTYVEFRSMGGDYVGKWQEIKNNILRFAQALTVACDPEAERKAYALKMYKLLMNGAMGGSDNDDIIRIFSMYNSGSWTKNQLRQYLKNRADQRKEDNRPF